MMLVHAVHGVFCTLLQLHTIAATACRHAVTASSSLDSDFCHVLRLEWMQG